MGGYGPGFGMMGGWGGGAMFPLSGIFGLLVLGLVIAALVWLARAILRPHDPPLVKSHAEADVSNGRTGRPAFPR